MTLDAKLTSYPCPCCGYVVFSGPPGSFDVCPICYWEDDPVQLLNLSYQGGANTVSLLEAQRSFVALGASEAVFSKLVRIPTESDDRERTWRPATDNDAKFSRTPASLTQDEYDDVATWYYWRRSSQGART